LIRKVSESLILVGVGHILPKSLEDVKRTITGEKPDVVALELCPARYSALKTGLGKGGSPGKDLMGWIIYLAQLRFSRETGVVPGEEMLTAAALAEKIGSAIELIDVPIDLTMRRLSTRVKIWERIRLVPQLILSLLPLGRTDLSRLTEERVVNELLGELKRFSAGMYEVLIEERNIHMASRLALLLSQGKKVVAVIGAAHVPGIEKILKSNVGWSLRMEYRI